MTKKYYYSEHTKTVHQFATSLFKSGIITKERMKEYDEGCLVERKEDQKSVKNVHKINGRAKVRAKSNMLQKAS